MDGCSQRAVVNGSVSRGLLITSGVPWESILGPVLFNICISDIGSEIERILNKLSAVDKIEGRNTIQRDLDTFENWSHENIIRFEALGLRQSQV